MKKNIYLSARFINEYLLVYQFLFIISLSMLDDLIDGVRYVKYIVPIVAMLASRSLIKFSTICITRITKPYFFLIVLFLFQSILFPRIDGWKDIYFLCVYIFPFILFKDGFIGINQILVFKILLIIFCIKFVILPHNRVSLTESTGIMEGTEAFIFGVFSLYFIIEKKFRWYALSLVIVFISMKRIVLFGVLVCSLSVITYDHVGRFLIGQLSLFFIGIILGVVVVLFGMGMFDVYIYEVTGLSANQLAMGRLNIYSHVIKGIVNNPLILIYGAGVGSSYQLVGLATSGADSNLHSDLLKIIYEGGAGVYSLFIWLLSNSLTGKNKCIILYVILMFVSDNIIIYGQVMFFVLLLSYSLEYNSSEF